MHSAKGEVKGNWLWDLLGDGIVTTFDLKAHAHTHTHKTILIYHSFAHTITSCDVVRPTGNKETGTRTMDCRILEKIIQIFFF